jgi:serine/threonine protein kinase
MELRNAIWKWYERHDNAINAVLEIAGGLIPGGNLVIQGVKAVHAYWKDKEENQDEEKAKEMEEKVEDVQDFLDSVQKPLLGLIEEIEDIPEFKEAKNPNIRRQLVQERVGPSLSLVLPQISVSMTTSVTKLTKKGSFGVINGKYELVRELGRGGQGIVYYARDREADKFVALKKLPKRLSEDPTAILLLRKEYNRVVDNLVHPNIVQYRNLSQDMQDQSWFLVMDYVPGQNMRKWMLGRSGEPMDWENAVSLLLPIADAS